MYSTSTFTTRTFSSLPRRPNRPTRHWSRRQRSLLPLAIDANYLVPAGFASTTKSALISAPATSWIFATTFPWPRTRRRRSLLLVWFWTNLSLFYWVLWSPIFVLNNIRNHLIIYARRMHINFDVFRTLYCLFTCLLMHLDTSPFCWQRRYYVALWYIRYTYIVVIIVSPLVDLSSPFTFNRNKINNSFTTPFSLV